jgi:hypothetical protein
MFSDKTEVWVYPLAVITFLLLVLGAIRVGRLLKEA